MPPAVIVAAWSIRLKYFRRMTRDTTVFDLIEQEKWRQMKGLELIASENFVSDQVLEAAGSVLTNKYAEGLPH